MRMAPDLGIASSLFLGEVIFHSHVYTPQAQRIAVRQILCEAILHEAQCSKVDLPIH